MNTVINSFISKINFSEVQQFENMALIPLICQVQENIQYMTMQEAMGMRKLIIKEISDSGSVPELIVINEADTPVFLLDGEELAGAKQNRIVNTSILLQEHSKTLIPVSCTEQGRWSYESEEFSESGNIMSPNIRASKSRSVSDSLKFSQSFESDQSKVWEGISKMADDAQTSSPTEAMQDIYEQKGKDLESYLKAFNLTEKQNGMLTFINGKIAGCDLIPYETGYAKLHAKIVKSYAMDALIQAPRKNGRPAYNIDDAKEFLMSARKCSSEKHKSVGYGYDHRVQGEQITGSALVHKKHLIHMALFRTEINRDPGSIRRASQRRDFMDY